MAQTVTDTPILQLPINAVFEQTFLRRAQQMCPYFIGSQPGMLDVQQGTSTIKWRRIEQETPTTTALSELTTTSSYMQGRDADTPTFTDVLATVAKYGQFYIVNEEVDLFNPNGTTNELVEVLGESAGRSLNQLHRDTLEENFTQRFAGNVASDGAVITAAAVGDLDYAINELTRNSARMFNPMANGSTNIGTVPILPGYWGICHPDVAYNISKLTGFVGVQQYAGQVAIAQNEFGLYQLAGRSLRFLMSEDASVDAGAGAPLSGADFRGTSGVGDLYTIPIFGRDATGSVGLGKRHTDGTYMAGENKGSFEMIFHPRGSGGISDPYNEIATLAWKAWYAGAVLNSNWGRSLRVLATNLAN